MRGDPQFIGENSIGHTPMGSELGLAPGLAFGVKVQATVVKRERISDNRWPAQMSYLLTNARPNPVTLDLVQRRLDRDLGDTPLPIQTRHRNGGYVASRVRRDQTPH